MSQHLEFIEMAKLKRPLGEAKATGGRHRCRVSAESGIPTFRDKENGLWSQFSRNIWPHQKVLFRTKRWFGPGMSGAGIWSCKRNPMQGIVPSPGWQKG